MINLSAIIAYPLTINYNNKVKYQLPDNAVSHVLRFYDLIMCNILDIFDFWF